MQIGSTVTLIYTGKTDEGEVFGYADAENPMKFQTGMDMVIDGFEREILAMEGIAGEKKTFTVDQYDAYGEYLDNFVQQVPLEQVPRGNVKVGQRIWMSSSDDGVPMPVTVQAVENGVVTFDMNHPLAGKDLTFEIEIIEIEDAPENFVSAKEKAEHMKQQSKLLGGDQGNDFR
ncbi:MULTISPECIES: peptidylprolyl isomerase [unclassified Adlercreutzia]|uniref:FKBP-type peptidyl-prolyl cis-trans isomerase n=1 Tax=unclassified Adlercreutzia TaxID=2636013 RepID=UPI0013ED5F44|nr:MULTISPECIES: FKBP-type peptidyl-prolyl cis-trans isomerase [unclassified Adlercreutzia]